MKQKELITHVNSECNETKTKESREENFPIRTKSKGPFYPIEPSDQKGPFVYNIIKK